MAASEIRRRPAGHEMDPDDADVRHQLFAHEPAGSRRGPGLDSGWKRVVAGGLAASRRGNYDVVLEQLHQAPPLPPRIGGSQARRDVSARQRVARRAAGLAAERPPGRVRAISSQMKSFGDSEIAQKQRDRASGLIPSGRIRL